MSKKRLVSVIAAVGLLSVSSVYAASQLNWQGEAKPVKELVQAENVETEPVDAPRDLKPGERVLEYDPKEREWKGSKQDLELIKNTIKKGIELDRGSMKNIYRGKDADMKKLFEEYFSASSGELKKRCDTFKRGQEINTSMGYDVYDTGVKVTFKGISVNGAEATAVADEVGWEKSRYKGEDGRMVDNTVDGGNQHTFRLCKEGGKWRIIKDDWVIIPGYEP